MEKRIWIKSGIVEELDAKQVRLIHLVFEKIAFTTGIFTAPGRVTNIP